MADVLLVLGSLFGDEGKGKIVDFLSKSADVVCRFQGGNNAGHTVVHDGKQYIFHLIPSGMVHPHTVGILGNGVTIDLEGLADEIDMAKADGIPDIESRLRISDRCHITCQLHKKIDRIEECWRGQYALGTTGRGVGPSYATKVNRCGLRMCDLTGDWEQFRQKFISLVEYLCKLYRDLQVDIEDCLQVFLDHRHRFASMVVNTVSLVNQLASRANCRVVIEGAQCTMLDVDFGTYPYVTSSNCTVGAVGSGLGLSPMKVTRVYGVIKAYTIRVGGGPFPTELFDQVGVRLQKVGKEWGATTGRKRRVGWLDTVVVRYTHQINCLSALALTKIDVLDELEEVKIGCSYVHQDTGEELIDFPADIEVLNHVSVIYKTLPGWKKSSRGCKRFFDLPKAAQQFVLRVEELCQVPIRWVGTGPSRDEVIERFR